ncbi:hypothetical protein BDV34DRAFT_219474 [Aspergillus parasiticus]|uniref:Rhodopsin domain-containing protein n=1 Tax=Aspergillus parasiticus TaxID=5067 RepID=A0A5N6E2D7_ASPPA|nr:hypothetical protein BDV34DRAFT_219474 [Aspergillus parasiticus]
MSGPSPSEIAYEEAHINETRQTTCYGVIITFYIIAIVMVGLRMAARRLQRARPSFGDYLYIAGIIFLIPFICATMGEIANGIGWHSITLTTHEGIMQMKWQVINLYSYTISITTIKQSILALLARTFSTAPRGFHICYLHTERMGDTLGHRLDLGLQLPVSTILQPRIIWNLHLVARKRLAVSISFFIGLVATLMGILKIAYIQGDKSDSYSIASALIFYAMEPLLASICSCLPAIPYVFRHVRLDSFHQLSILVRSLNNSKNSGIKKSRNNSRYPSSRGTSTDAVTELAKRSGEVV